MIPSIITLLNGDKMFIDELDSLGLRANGIHEKEETEFIKSFITGDMVCVDIGANIGYFTILMAKQAKHIYAFEADKSNFIQLRKNIELNG